MFPDSPEVGTYNLTDAESFSSSNRLGSTNDAANLVDRTAGGRRPPEPKPETKYLPDYHPGAPAQQLNGLTSYKISSNELPYGPLPDVRAAALSSLEWNRYSDPSARPLREEISSHLNVQPECIVAGAGSLDLLNKILTVYAGRRENGEADEVIFAWRSFEAYPISVYLTGARPVQVPLREGSKHDLAAFSRAITKKTRAIIICSPNNPTGPALTGTELDSFLKQVPEGILVILDEAYIDFVKMDDPIESIHLLRKYENVAILRTFSKAHGLADLRVGYCIANPEVASIVQRGVVPFAVSGIGQAAAIASLQHFSDVSDRATSVIEERDRICNRLRSSGWSIPDTQGNFFWLPLGTEAERFSADARERGLSVRAFPGEGVRVSIGPREANDRVISLCGGWMPPADIRRDARPV